MDNGGVLGGHPPHRVAAAGRCGTRTRERGRSWRLFRARDGAPETRTLLAEADGGLLLRGADGGSVWVTADGAEVPMAPAFCRGDPVQVWGEAPAAVFACAYTTEKRELILYDRAGAHVLGTEVGLAGRRIAEGRLLITGDTVRDLATGRAWPRADGGEDGLWHDALLEVDRGGMVTLRDLATGELRPFVGPFSGYVYGRQYGRYVALVGGGTVLVVDLQDRRAVGTLPRRPILVRPDGAALLPDDEVNGFATGPLRWWAPPGR